MSSKKKAAAVQELGDSAELLIVSDFPAETDADGAVEDFPLGLAGEGAAASTNGYVGGSSLALPSTSSLVVAGVEFVNWDTEGNKTDLPTGLRFVGAVKEDDYKALLYTIGAQARTAWMMIGDLLNEGERVWGETYVQFAQLTGLSEATVKNYAWVCNKIDAERRRPQLGPGFHMAVAKCVPQEQDAWLNAAIANGWTEEELRAQMRAVVHEVDAKSVKTKLLENDTAKTKKVEDDKVIIPDVDLVAMARIIWSVINGEGEPEGDNLALYKYAGERVVRWIGEGASDTLIDYIFNEQTGR